MVQHTQTIRRQQPTNCLKVLDHFVGLVLKGLRSSAGAPCTIIENVVDGDWAVTYLRLVGGASKRGRYF